MIIRPARISYEASWAALSLVAAILTWEVDLHAASAGCLAGVLYFGWLALQCARRSDWTSQMDGKNAVNYATMAAAFLIFAALSFLGGAPLALALACLWTAASAAALAYAVRGAS